MFDSYGPIVQGGYKTLPGKCNSLSASESMLKRGSFISGKSLYPLIESLFHSLIWYSWILLVCVIWGVPSLIHRSCGWYIIDLFWFYGPPWDMCDGSFKFLNLPSLQEPILYTYLFILPSLDCNMGADFARVQVQLVLVDNRYVPF